MGEQQRTGGEDGWVGELIDSTRGVALADGHTEFSPILNSGISNIAPENAMCPSVSIDVWLRAGFIAAVIVAVVFVFSVWLRGPALRGGGCLPFFSCGVIGA
jgi:hypothetical protein